MTKELHHRLDAVTEMPAVLVMGNPEWRPSLVGLAANKLAEEHGRPAFIWGRDGNGVLKGSCRSGGSVSVVTLMNEVTDVFLEFGGHHMSGGFSVREEKIHDLAAALQMAHQTLGSAAVITKVHQVDLELSLNEVTKDLLKAQRLCAPFGADNAKPIYLIHNVVPREVSAFGKTKEHTKLLLTTTGVANEAIAFFKTPDQFTKQPVAAEACSLLVHLEESFFMGRLQTRLRIVDIL
jgi:single-stranded-DNA-specific exonuclease